MRRVSAMGVRWPGYAATVWALLFAVPSFVWALGGTVGARTTVSPSLVKLAQDRVTWFVVVLWVTGALKLIGALIGVGLLRLGRRGVARVARLAVRDRGGARRGRRRRCRSGTSYHQPLVPLSVGPLVRARRLGLRCGRVDVRAEVGRPARRAGRGVGRGSRRARSVRGRTARRHRLSVAPAPMCCRYDRQAEVPGRPAGQGGHGSAPPRSRHPDLPVRAAHGCAAVRAGRARGTGALLFRGAGSW